MKYEVWSMKYEIMKSTIKNIWKNWQYIYIYIYIYKYEMKLWNYYKIKSLTEVNQNVHRKCKQKIISTLATKDTLAQKTKKHKHI